jgi:hypothetical protein
MNVSTLLDLLRKHPGHGLVFHLPDRAEVPPHFHVTEVGHATRTFLDCGGKRHTSGACLLQLWIADDTDHRLVASKLLSIFERADGLLPSTELPVEIEHEGPVLTQLPITRLRSGSRESCSSIPSWKHTDCLAKDLCLPDFSLPAIPGQPACNPASGCC